MKILIIQLRQLGDVILTTPLIRQLREKYQNAQIDFLTEESGSNIYLYNKNINNLIVFKRKANLLNKIKHIYQIYKQKYDIVIDCLSNPSSAQISFFSRAPQRIGFNLRGRNYAYTKKISLANSNEYAAISKLRLAEHLGLNLNDYKIEFPISDKLQQFAINFAHKYKFNNKTIAFFVVSRRNYKIWNPLYFAKTGNWLIEKGYKLFFIYGPNEQDIAKKVYDDIIIKEECVFYYEMPNVAELRSILDKCCMYVGNDGGPKHLSVCANIPTITVFGSINPNNWTEPNSTQHHVIANNNITCYHKCKSCQTMKCYHNLSDKNLIETINLIIS